MGGIVELWKLKSAGLYKTKWLLETGEYESPKERKALMSTWNRKHNSHKETESRFYMWVIKPNDYDVDDRGTSGVLENETIGYSPIEDFAEVQY
jgi:hypothetical protein